MTGTTTHIFETGRFTSLPCIFTIAERTKPLGSGNVFKIRPKGHLLLGVFLSTRITMLFTITLRFASYYFLRYFMVGKYSWAHRLQKRLAKCWAWRHLRTIKESLFAVSVGGIPDAGQSCSTLLGVRGLLISSTRKLELKVWN